jgi:DNA-binding beta-propeller fold protein YncE
MLLMGTLLVLASCAQGSSGEAASSLPVSSSRIEALPSTVSTTTTLPPTTTTLPPTTTTPPPTTTTTLAPARRVTIDLEPVDAKITLRTADSTRMTVATPYVGKLVSPITVSAQVEGFNPVREQLWAARSRSFTLWLDPQGQLLDKIVEFSTGLGPKQVAFTPDGRELWVTLLGGEGVEVFRVDTGKRLAVIDLPDFGAVEVMFEPSGEKAYVSQMETATVFEIDVATKEVLRRFSTDSSWTKVMALSPDGTMLFASNWIGNDVSIIDLTSGDVTRRLPTVRTPRGLYVTPDGAKLYVAGFDQGEIEVFDLESFDSRVVHSSGGHMRHLVGDPQRGLVYGSDMGTNEAVVVDTATDEVRVLAATDDTPNTMDLTPDGRVLAVSNRGMDNPESYYLPGPQWGSIILIDSRTGAYLDAVVGGNQPTGLDISPDGKWLAYSDFLDDRVTVLSIPPTRRLLSGDGGRSAIYRDELDK